MQVWQVRDEEVTRWHGLEAPGHRSDIRTVALASDDSMLLSGSNNEVKIWNPRSGACLRTIEAGYGLCALFAPGNRHAVVGTKSGSLDLLDVAASSMVQSVPAHAGAVWSLAGLPDSRSALLPHATVVQVRNASHSQAKHVSAICIGEFMFATQANDNGCTLLYGNPGRLLEAMSQYMVCCVQWLCKWQCSAGGQILGVGSCH